MSTATTTRPGIFGRISTASETVRDTFVGRGARGAVPLLVGVVVLQLWAVLDWTGIMTRGLPLGIVLNGAVFGSLYGLIGIGLVLVYRANRVVNFAQAELGSMGTILAIELITILDVNYFLAVPAGFIAAALTGVLVDYSVIRPFRHAPRLILAVATIGVAQVLSGLSIQIPIWWQGPEEGQQTTLIDSPFDLSFAIGPKTFLGTHVVVLVVVPLILVGLTWFLRFTDYGVAIRAAADNGDRANLLGIPVRRLSTITWGIAAFLSAVAAFFRVELLGFASFTGVSGAGPGLLLRTFAAAMVARMTSLPIALAAGIGIGIFEQAAVWQFSNANFADGLLVVVILIALLAQKGAFARFAETGISTWEAMKEVRPIPHELRRTPEVRWGLRGLGVAIAVFVLTFPLYVGPSREQLMSLIFIFAMVAVSLVILTGWVGQISLGQWALAGFGAGAAGILVGRHGLDLFIALPAAMAAGALAALIIGLPALRIKGPFLAVTTLAFAVTAGTLLLEDRYLPWFVERRLERPVLWDRLPIEADWQFYYFSLAALALVVIAAVNLRRSRTGRAMIATRDNEPATQSVSLNTTGIKLTAFVISGAIAGLAGGVYVLHQRGLHTASFGPEVSLLLFTMVVIGGLGSLQGAILGAVYVGSVQFFLPESWALLTSGFGIVLLLMFLPGGLGQALHKVRDRLLRHVADRHGLLVPSLIADMRGEEEEAVPDTASPLEEAGETDEAEETTEIPAGELTGAGR